jgi:hypothetical protein
VRCQSLRNTVSNLSMQSTIRLFYKSWAKEGVMGDVNVSHWFVIYSEPY